MRKLFYALIFVAANFTFAAQAPLPTQPGSHTSQPPTQSDMVQVVVAPTMSSIITADFQYNDTTTITAPWFAHNVTVTNNSDETVTIIALSYHVTGKRADGTTVSKDITISPSMYNFTESCSGGTTQEVDFQDFGQFAPGTSGQLSLTPRNGGSPVMVCGSMFEPLTPLQYVGGNPSVNADHVTNYQFDVQMTPIGWFGTVTAPDSRFNKTVTFQTE